MVVKMIKSDVNEILTEFGNCLMARYDELSEVDKGHIESWVYSVKLINSSVILRPDSLIKLTDKIFLDEVVRDFVLELGFRFFTTVAYGENFNVLIDCLTNGLMLDGPDPSKCFIPEPVKQSMATTLYRNSSIIEWIKSYLNKIGFSFDSPIKALLRNNKVLMIVILINLTYAENATK